MCRGGRHYAGMVRWCRLSTLQELEETMSQASSSQSYALPATNFYSGFSGASDSVRTYILDREQSVRVRIAKQREEALRNEANAFRIIRAVYRVGLLISAVMLVAITARIGNHVVYFASGVDYQLRSPPHPAKRLPKRSPAFARRSTAADVPHP